MRGVKKENEKEVTNRRFKAKELRDRGLTYEDTGKVLGISRQRVHQILKRAGVKPKLV